MKMPVTLIEQLKYHYYFYLFFFIKYFSWKKFFNLFLIFDDYRLKRTLVRGKPFIASIDPSNVCVLHCPLCPTGRNDPGVKKKILRFEEFKKYFDEIKDYLFVIRFYNWGEPFLAKDIFRMIEYAHKNNVGVVINSNLNITLPHLAENIVKSRLDQLVVSIDGIRQETYGKYRRGGNLEKVFKVIKEINLYKRENKSNLPILHWGYLVNKFNYRDIKKAKIVAKKFSFNLITFPMLTMITKIGDKFIASNKDYWLGKELTGQRGETKPPKNCYFLWTSVNISPNGDVFPCCGIFEDKYKFGNLNRNNLEGIWNNNKFKAARSLFGNNKGLSTSVTICHQCDWFEKNV